MRPDEVAHLATSTRLADGSTIRLRPIMPSDGPLLQDGFSRLSPESRFLRFFSPLDHLSEAQLRYFTEIDYVDHFAWVATVEHDQAPPIGVGVARYIRCRDDLSAAEAAIAVTDDHHRMGIGSLMLESLAAVALGHGIAAFHLMVRSDNTAMTALMDELGAVRAPNDDAAVLRYVIELPALIEELRGTPLWSIFRRVAALPGGGSAEECR
jgi:GNAT superfamily N-acetyltransferase